MLPEARAYLERLMADAPNQLLKPEAVVDAARPRNSPLHAYFTWNNAEAARPVASRAGQDAVAFGDGDEPVRARSPAHGTVCVAADG